MKKLLGFGLSLPAVRHLSQDALANMTENLKDEVPRLERLKIPDHEKRTPKLDEEPPDRESIYYTIPYDEWEHTEAVFDAAEKLQLKIDEAESTGRIDAAVTTTVKGGDRTKAISVKYTTEKRKKPIAPDDGEFDPEEIEEGDSIEYEEIEEKPSISTEELRDLIPDTASGVAGPDAQRVENIPVLIEEVTLERDNYYTDEYRPVPGGCAMQSARFWGNGTIGTPAIKTLDDGSNKPVVTTSGHVIEHDIDTRVYQPGGYGTSFGYAQDYIDDGYDDAGYMDLTRAGSQIEWSLVDTVGTIAGIISYDAIKDHVGDSDWIVHKQGRTTGLETGYVRDTSTSGSLNWFTLSGDVDRDDGDSGGPVYRLEGADDIYILGHHNWGVNTDDGVRAGGNVMEDVEDYFNITVSF